MASPNIVLILADDMGFSDIGCYGGEVKTPNLDSLAHGGVRFSQFYNTARCSPSRASLLTGLHPHQTGIGVLTADDSPRGYPGTINGQCATIAEVLKTTGYTTCLCGKWHLSSQMHTPSDAWPTRRGFDRFYGTLSGCGSYFEPCTLTRGETNIEHEAMRSDFYYTDAISDEACSFVRDQEDAGNPFFLYVAYTAPHWPLHAFDEDIQKYDGAFDEGWDVLRERRMVRLKEAAIVGADAALSPRDPCQPAWEDAQYKAWQARRMEVYAAQIDRMDQGVGRIIDSLVSTGAMANTLLIFLSDNGASPEDLPMGKPEKFRQKSEILKTQTRDGRDVHIGNEPQLMPGSDDTYASYGRAWANLSNTPFRQYKRWTHEGGIATPLIVHWPKGELSAGTVVHAPFQLTDIMPTILEATSTQYPAHLNGRRLTPVEGRSLLGPLRGISSPDGTLFWEHTGNCAIRQGRWKMLREFPMDWELYDISVDRAELRNMADQFPEVVSKLALTWDAWAVKVGVIPWESMLDIYRQAGKADADAAG